jgi:hypothetical protein
MPFSQHGDDMVGGPAPDEPIWACGFFLDSRRLIEDHLNRLANKVKGFKVH